MWSVNFVIVTLLLCGAGFVCAQEGGASCYGGGSIATSVILTTIILLVLAGAGYVAWKKYGKYKKGKHLILETDPEKGVDYAFDNPGFTDTGLTPLGKVIDKSNVENSARPKWANWSSFTGLTNKSEKKKTMDDSALGENEVKTVSLRSHDFTGLGFNIFGNMRDGIFIKDILHRGPASESGKLNPGDRITSITINFEHIVYEDALTILSYASPYEVIVHARNGKLATTSTGPIGQPIHPLYKSSSSTDLIHIGRSAKKRLFQAEELNDSLALSSSSLQKTRSNATTLERSPQNSPNEKPINKKLTKTTVNPEQLKSQLEQTILEDNKENLKNKENYEKSLKAETEIQKTENSFQKFGIKVLPMEQKEQKSPKIAELSQNDNNINIERNIDRTVLSIDEVDKKPAPPVKKRDKKIADVAIEVEPFRRGGSLTGSGIRRDENGIPQEIPNHMMNAAVAARRNRRPSEENLDDSKLSKKMKGKAPAPPEDIKQNEEEIKQKNSASNLDKIYPAELEVSNIKSFQNGDKNSLPIVKKDFESDSDEETDNLSSVNTIELNSSDITIHQTEDNEEKQNRRTASTGDLSKIQRTRKTSTGTLERAQSLDITDTGMPVLSLTRKTGVFEEKFDSKNSSSDSLYGNALINKEPRLSLILDGLNTFQRSRLKKSTEWGNLEDAILNKSDSSENCETGEKMFETDSSNDADSFDLTSKTPVFDALVNKIKEIKEETAKKIENQEKEIRDSWSHADELLTETLDSLKKESKSKQKSEVQTKTVLEKKEFVDDKQKDGGYIFVQSKADDEVSSLNTDRIMSNDSSFVTDVLSAVNNLQIQNTGFNSKEENTENLADKETSKTNANTGQINIVDASIDLLKAERKYCDNDLYHIKLDDTNVPDDIKVSRHTFGSIEAKHNEIPVKAHLKDNISNITISDKYVENNPQFDFVDTSLNSSKDVSEQYTTALDETIINLGEKVNISYDKVLVSTPDLIKNVSIAEAIHELNNEVTIEGPTSLTFEIKSPDVKETILNNTTNIPLGLRSDEFHITNLSNGSLKGNDNADVKETNKPNSSLTYITEIQVLTPNNKNVSEVEINSKNLDNDFENFVRNFESKSLDNRPVIVESAPEMRTHSISSFNEKIDPEKELHKIQEIAEEQLKKLPEMRFTTNYDTSKTPEKRQSQIELLRSNFERSPPKSKTEVTPIKSRIPIATSKTPPTSPERRDSRNLDLEVDKEIIEIMTSGIHSTPKYLPKTTTRNVTVTSIRNSKIPSGLPTYGNRPPVPPRKSDSSEAGSVIQLSSNGNTDNSFKQWVFNPSDSITNIAVTDTEMEK